jgi:RNA polymerase sigma-70 factor (ECF subfamily)
VRAAGLQVQEGRVEGGEAMGLGHAPMMTFNAACWQPCTKWVWLTHKLLKVAPAKGTQMLLEDPHTFSRMYDEHHRGVYGAAYRILGNQAQAQDVAQDVFLRIWRSPGKFDSRRGELGSYLRLMARSRALDVWREGQAAGRASDRLKLVVAKEEPRVEDRPAPMAELESDRSAVRDALKRLPTAQREAVVMAYWGGLTADQIAKRAGVPLGTAKSRIRLGLAKLRDEVESSFEQLMPEAA